MRKFTYLGFVIAVAAAFAISGFDFENPSFEANSKEYILFLIIIILSIIFLINRFSGQGKK